MAGTATISCTEVWGGNRAAEAALVLPGVSGWVLSRPFHGADAGGDVHYVSSCGTGRITRVLLADVSGHGDEVADVGRKLRRLMQRYLNHEHPQKLAARLNRDMAGLSGDTGRFATALVITFFAPKGALTVCNAGHPTPLIYRAASQTWAPVDQPDTDLAIANLPLGVVEESGYVGRELTLDPGDLILAYTDCITEAANDAGELLGQPGLLDALAALDPDTVAGTPSELTAALLGRVESMGYRLDDDLTAIVLKCTDRSGGAPLGDMLLGGLRFLKMALNPKLLPWPDGLLRR